MKNRYILAALAIGAMSLTSCVDDLDQRPVFEQDATVVYSSPESYRQVLAKAYACFVITGQEKDGNPDIDSEKGYDLSRCIFNMQEDATDESINTWSSLYDVSHFNWDANDVWVQDAYYRL
ncbi:RagB/SusD family nutrient uptake outer membrane protein, partial [Muribaculaceae bacterium Isolate-013 (NCI)]